MLRCAILVVAAAAAFFVPVSGLAQVTVEEQLAPEQPPVIIAHRALGGDAPENSLAGIQNAIRRGIDMVEIDVQITHEGNYILMHDTSLTRTTNVGEVFPDGAPSREPGDPDALRYLVSDYTLEDIAQLRLLDPNGRDHSVPTLDAALDAAEGRLLVILDLKRWDEVSLIPLLERRESSNILLYSQTYQRKLAAVAVAAGVGVYTRLIGLSDYDRGMNIALERFGPQLVMISVSPSAVTQTLIETGEERGVRVGTNGLGFQDQKQRVGSSAPWLELLETGAAAFTTQLPDEVMHLLGR